MMLWNILRKLSLLHRRGVFEALLMVAAGFLAIRWADLGGPDPMEILFAKILIGIGAAVLASLAYWIGGILVFLVKILWALGGVLLISIRARLGKVGSL